MRQAPPPTDSMAHCWARVPLLAHCCTLVPLAALPPLTSSTLPLWALTMV